MSPTAGPTVRDLDTRIDDLEKAFTDFKGRAEMIIMLGKWLAGFTAARLVSLLLLAFSVVYSAGGLSAQVENQGQEVGRLNDKIDRLSVQIEDLRKQPARS